jgi:Putative DNA-binding domain
MLAKAVCGMTNSEGGVLVIGMRAESKPKDEPDVVSSAAPVTDTAFVRSRILGLISNLVEPGIVGILSAEISEQQGSKSGFVVVYVPKSDGSPRRSRKDSKFYLRIGSATLPMEYWQIEDRFGKRPHPKLTLLVEPRGITNNYYSYHTPTRWFVLGLTNTGLGIARFPGLRFRHEMGLTFDQYGIDGNGGFGLPLRPSESDWIVFRGGVDDIIYAGETRLVGKLAQHGRPAEVGANPGRISRSNSGPSFKTKWFFPVVNFQCEISCEGFETQTMEQVLAEDYYFTDN